MFKADKYKKDHPYSQFETWSFIAIIIFIPIQQYERKHQSTTNVSWGSTNVSSKSEMATVIQHADQSELAITSYNSIQ